jgi:hypothetical protein
MVVHVLEFPAFIISSPILPKFRRLNFTHSFPTKLLDVFDFAPVV